ncbi:hypothetical protein CDL12_17964 [Handroanthus impetiginosus]|uniref:Uncharacterized protein n=1 Tax=Handroanthus impetiginosus TaxID=429701 RepID=A0A2G9GWQ6_9LAMI|nr:hypothetical protein CDL12_17964 [Handroanthus impetiginosus]
MENPLINPHNLALKSHNFPLPNGISDHNHGANHHEGIAMFTFQSISYTSLKDLLPASPPSTASPTSSRRDSWREIPIKDPLLQHAARAYLQPMAAEHVGDERWCRRIRQKWCRLFGCFNDVVLVVFEGWFCDQASEGLTVDDDTVG